MSHFSRGHRAGGFRLDSPVKLPVASEMPRCAPPHTFGAGEEPSGGGQKRKRLEVAGRTFMNCGHRPVRVDRHRTGSLLQTRWQLPGSAALKSGQYEGKREEVRC